jgi:hypothetical protein
VFPSGPERGVYNNALLERDLGLTERASAFATWDGSSNSRRKRWRRSTAPTDAAAMQRIVMTTRLEGEADAPSGILRRRTRIVFVR